MWRRSCKRRVQRRAASSSACLCRSRETSERGSSPQRAPGTPASHSSAAAPPGASRAERARGRAPKPTGRKRSPFVEPRPSALPRRADPPGPGRVGVRRLQARQRPGSRRAVEDERRLRRIRELHAANGYRRIWKALLRAGNGARSATPRQRRWRPSALPRLRRTSSRNDGTKPTNPVSVKAGPAPSPDGRRPPERNTHGGGGWSACRRAPEDATTAANGGRAVFPRRGRIHAAARPGGQLMRAPLSDPRAANGRPGGVRGSSTSYGATTLSRAGWNPRAVGQVANSATCASTETMWLSRSTCTTRAS